MSLWRLHRVLMQTKLRANGLGLRTAFMATVIVLGHATFLRCAELLPAQTPGRPDFCGVWGIWGGEKVSTNGRPWFKGVVVTVNWEDVEPEQGRFDWSRLDSKVASVAGKGLSVMLLVYHGTKVPGWVYAQVGVPKVLTGEKRGRNRQLAHPYYLHPAYKPLLTKLIHETAKHTAAYPPEIRRKIVGVQCPTGKSGDPQPYSGPVLDKQYDIDAHGKEWIDWSIGMFQVYLDAWRDFKPPFFLLFKGPEPESNEWLIHHAPDSWHKPHAVAQGYQMNNEMDYAMDLYPWTHAVKDGILVRSRGELDNTENEGKNWFNAAPDWNVYWSGLWVLTWGLDIWNQLPGVLQDVRYAPTLSFVSRYAGYKHPTDAPGAWVALRDALDAADLKRFPEDKFGEYGGSPANLCHNAERYKKIAEACKAFGARLDDPEHLDVNGLDTRHLCKGLNDVGCNIWRGNYGMFMTQVAPDETSQGYWRVGATNERFGRYARGFDHAAGKDALYFQLEQGFFSGAPPSGGHLVRVRVVYYDKGTGAWALHYDAMGNPNQTALTVRKKDSGRWQEVSVVLRDGRFSRAGKRNSDFSLVNPDDENDLFHLIEVEKMH